MQGLFASLLASLSALVGLMLADRAMATEAAASAAVALAAPASPVSADYLIGPGDTLEIFVWRNPDLTITVPVRPDGKISTPLVEDMVAVGKTPTGLARDIEKALGMYVKSSQVNVIVTLPASVFSQIKMIGQVLHPKPYPIAMA